MTVASASLPGSATAPRQSRVVFLDVVRGLAALIVLLQHTNEAVARPYLRWSYAWCNLGRTGVAAFFLLSGFVIPYSLERANSLKHFWVSRFFRLYPLYWTSLILVTVLYFAGIYTMPAHWSRALLANITMFQEFLRQPHIIGLYWTLSLEMVFYVLVSVLFALGINKRSLLLAWLGLGGLVLTGLLDRNGIDHGAHLKLPVARLALIVFALIGTVVFRFYSGLVSRRQLGTLVLGALVALTISMRLGFRGPTDPIRDPEEWSWLSMVTSHILAGGLFASIYMLRSVNFPWVLRWLGNISYSVYLLHYPTWLMLWKIPHAEYPSALLWIGAVIIATCLLSSAVYILIERPAIELGKRVLNRPHSQTAITTESQPSPAPG